MVNTINKLLNSEKLEVATGVFRAFAHPLRLKILKFINDNDKTNVQRIYSSLRLEQSITSQHLRVLRDAGLVLTIRSGKFIFYSLNHDNMDTISDAVQTFLGS